MTPPADLRPCRKCKKIPLILDCDWTEPITYHAACDCKTTNHTSQESCIAEWNEENRPQPIAGDAWEEAIKAAAEVAERMKPAGRLEPAWSTEERACYDVLLNCAAVIRALRRPAQPQPSGTELIGRLCRAIDALLACPEIADAAPEDKDEGTHAAEREARNARDEAFTAAIDRPAREGVEITLHRGTVEPDGRKIASFFWPEELGDLSIPTKWQIRAALDAMGADRA